MVKRRLHVIISGNVQGVFFRSTLQEHCKARRITGWVKNLADGRVEAVMEGEEDDLQKILLFCSMGPEGARVQKVDKKWSVYTGEYTEFTFA